MAVDVGASYDAVAEQYAALFLRDLDHNSYACDWLAIFAERAAMQQGVVADLGCGPGHVTNHLSQLDLDVVGYDLSRGQIAQARQAFPQLRFDVADFTTLEVDDASLGGIVSRYSILHLVPSRLGEVFAEWYRVLEPSAPVLVTFYGSLAAESHGLAFNHRAVTAYELWPATVADHLRDAGFVEVESDFRPPAEGGRPFNQATLLAHTPA